jgi:hypothetical protein
VQARSGTRFIYAPPEFVLDVALSGMLNVIAMRHRTAALVTPSAGGFA